MESSAEAEYAAFELKVGKTVYLDNLSPQVTEPVLKTALNQFGNVVNVQFIPNYLKSNCVIQAALVEMETQKQAEEIISEMVNSPFMMSGMPRPVRALKAEKEMFDDRPRKPGKKIVGRWLDPKDPDFEVAKKIKLLTKRHAAEASFLLKQQLAEEEKLHNLQAETLKANHKKYDLIDSAKGDGSLRRLATRYGTRFLDAD